MSRKRNSGGGRGYSEKVKNGETSLKSWGGTKNQDHSVGGRSWGRKKEDGEKKEKTIEEKGRSI